MKSSRTIAIAALPCFLMACTGTPPVKNVETPKEAPKNIVHHPVSDITVANAGGAKCAAKNVQQIGALAKDGGIAIGFGDHGGLAAWSSPEGLRVKPLSSAGVASGSAVSISFPKGSKPAEIAPVDRGFALIAKRAEKTDGPCEASCGDKPCADAKPAEAAAQACEKITGYEYFVQLTGVDGKNISAGRPFHTGPVDIETILPGDGRAFGILTKNEVVWIQKRPDGRLDATRVELPSVDYVIPVRRSGPPAVLLLQKDGTMQLLDERGTHEIEGKFVGMAGKPAPAAPAKPEPKPGAKPPAKPAANPAKPAATAPAPAKPTGEMPFLSHWGPKGRIEIVRRLGDATQFAALEKLVLRMVPDAESQEFRDSFASSVYMHLENGLLRRTAWDKRPVGEDLDVRALDPAANGARARAVWSGNAIVFAHPSSPPHQPDTQAVGIVAATCGGDKP